MKPPAPSFPATTATPSSSSQYANVAPPADMSQPADPARALQGTANVTLPFQPGAGPQKSPNHSGAPLSVSSEPFFLKQHYRD